MTASLIAAACALLCWSSAPARLPTPRSQAAAGVDRSIRPLLMGGATVAAVLLVWPAAVVPAIGAGTVLGAAAWWDGRRRSTRPVREAGEVALLCDLWAGCLDVGMPTGGALAAALEVLGGHGDGGSDPTVRRLVQVAGLLRVGADVGRAWQPAEGDAWLEPIGVAARRAEQVGTDLAATVRAQARAVRRAAAGAGERRAQRAGVLMTAPLTLCFLPAFICLGLAPVVIALLGTLDLGR